MALLDFIFALYIIETASKNIVMASIWASGIQICNAVLILAYTRTWKTVFPAIVGAFVGTYGAIYASLQT